MSEMYEFPEEYQKAWDAYFYPGTNVLKNKLGITDYDELVLHQANMMILKTIAKRVKSLVILS